MKHLTAVLVLSLTAAVATAQVSRSSQKETKAAATKTEKGEKGGESSQAAQPAPSQGPTVERSSSGVVVIKSSSGATQAARQAEAKAAEQQAKAAEEAKKGGKEETKAKQAEPASKKPQPPKAREVEAYVYGPNGERTKAPVTVSERNSASSGHSTQTIVGTDGNRIPYISTQEKVVSESAGHKVVERRVQRYDTQGQPTRQALVKDEERKLADGTIERVTTVFEQDVNGNLQPAERKVSRETTTGNKTRTVVTTERAAASGGFQAVEQKESVETKQGENSATVETVVKRPSVNGQLTESARERSVMEKSGSTATTQTEVWERSTATGEVALSKRTVGKRVERPDGSLSESVQVYGYSKSGGGASDANAGDGPRLAETIQRDVTVKPNGEKVETTTTQGRSVANPSQLGQQEKVQKVTRPSSDGETVETQVYEQGVNGKLQPTQVVVEKVKK